MDYKPYSSRRNTGYRHVYISTDDSRYIKLSVSRGFWDRVLVGDSLVITPKSSRFGYYIDEDEILINKKLKQ